MKFNKYHLLGSLLCISMTAMTMQQDKSGEHSNCSVNAPKIVHSFIQEALQGIGFNRPNLAIKVIPQNGGSSGWTTGHEMTMPNDEVDLKNPQSLINLLQKQNHTPQELEKINLCKGIVQHEGTHLKNNDHTNMRIAQWATFSLMTSALVYGWLNKRPSKTFTQGAMKRLGFISATISVLLANSSVLSAYSRYIEQRADNGIADNINVLQAHANYFRKQAEEEEQSMLIESDGKGGSREKSRWKKIDNSLFDSLARAHPSNKQRAERFENRIAKLKAQQEQK